MRINARLDDRYADKLTWLREQTGQSLSDVVRESIERCHAEVEEQAKRDATALDDLVGGFNGFHDAPADLSADYKRYLLSDQEKVG